MTTLVDRLIRPGQYDHVLFLAHSQGTVVVYDYLRSVMQGGGMLGRLRPDVITLGSPLAHLYEYYFDEYHALPEDLRELQPTVGRWINMYRCDDAIGGRIGTVDTPFLDNIALAPGGHLGYWTNDEVVAAIERLLCPVALQLATAAGSATAQRPAAAHVAGSVTGTGLLPAQPMPSPAAVERAAGAGTGTGVAAADPTAALASFASTLARQRQAE